MLYLWALFAVLWLAALNRIELRGFASTVKIPAAALRRNVGEFGQANINR